MSLVHNERTKLLANALDRASTACFTVGVATPAAGFLYNLGGLRESASGLALAGGFAGFFLVAVALHLLARRLLGGLQ